MLIIWYVLPCFVCAQSLSRIQLFATPWTVAHQAPLQARIQVWVAIPFSQGSSWPRDLTQVSCIAGRFFTIWAPALPTAKVSLPQVYLLYSCFVHHPPSKSRSFPCDYFQSIIYEKTTWLKQFMKVSEWLTVQTNAFSEILRVGRETIQQRFPWGSYRHSK